MTRSTRRWVTLSAALGLVVGTGFVSGLFSSSSPWVAHADPKGIKYTGSGSCAAAACHGAEAEKEDGTTRHNENTVWSKDDPHNAKEAYKSLTGKDAKEIAGKMKIADATKDFRCLSCHSTSGLSLAHGANRVEIPADLQGDKFTHQEGVSCDSCHGPATEYLKPHTAKGWTEGKRKELGSEKLYDTTGLYDTKNLKFRANTCLSCHLKIDHEMVAAGHPELPFELNNYSTREWIHWRDKGEWSGVSAWAMGQAISLREAAFQLGDRAKAKAGEEMVKNSYDQVAAYGLLTRQLATVVDPATKDAIDAQITAAHGGWADGAKVAEAMTALAKVADELGNKLIAFKFDKEKSEKLFKGVLAESEQGTKVGFRPAEQITYGLDSLAKSLEKDGKVDVAKITPAIEKLYEFGTIKEDFDAAKFNAAAKELNGVMGGGASLPWPAGGPVK